MAKWECESEWRRGFVAPGVGDGKEWIAWLGGLCRCGGVVEGEGEGRQAGRCAACEGVVYWGRRGRGGW